MSTTLCIVGILVAFIGGVAMLLTFVGIMPIMELGLAFGAFISGLLLISVGIALQHLATIAKASQQKAASAAEAQAEAPTNV
jgi:hypothetical protein